MRSRVRGAWVRETARREQWRSSSLEGRWQQHPRRWWHPVDEGSPGNMPLAQAAATCAAREQSPTPLCSSSPPQFVSVPLESLGREVLREREENVAVALLVITEDDLQPLPRRRKGCGAERDEQAEQRLKLGKSRTLRLIICDGLKMGWSA